MAQPEDPGLSLVPTVCLMPLGPQGSLVSLWFPERKPGRPVAGGGEGQDLTSMIPYTWVTREAQDIPDAGVGEVVFSGTGQ